MAGLDLLSQPHLPVDVVGLGPRGDGVVPLAVGIVAHVAALAHDDGADLAGADPFGGLVPLAVGAALGADLEQLAGALAGVVDLERFAEIAGHGLLDVDVLPGVHGLAADLGVPVVDGGAEDDVDVLALEHAAEVLVAVGLHVGLLLDLGDVVVDAVLGDVADGGEADVVLLVVLQVQADVRTTALVADTDEADDDLVIGPDHPAGIGRGELGEGVGRGGGLVGEDSGDAAGRGGALEEFAPGGTGLRGGGVLRRGHGSGALNVTGDGRIVAGWHSTTSRELRRIIPSPAGKLREDQPLRCAREKGCSLPERTPGRSCSARSPSSWRIIPWPTGRAWSLVSSP